MVLLGPSSWELVRMKALVHMKALGHMMVLVHMMELASMMDTRTIQLYLSPIPENIANIFYLHDPQFQRILFSGRSSSWCDWLTRWRHHWQQSKS